MTRSGSSPVAGEAAAAFLETVLDVMVEDKALPKYRFEPLAAIFLAPFLPRILEHFYGGEIQHVVPEFPLKKRDSYQSTNVDFLLVRRAQEECFWILFELKTDVGSVNRPQLETYCRALNGGMMNMVADLHEIRERSKKKKKYDVLLERLGRGAEGLQGCDQVRLVYLTPEVAASSTPDGCNNDNLLWLRYEDLPQQLSGPHESLWPLVRGRLVEKILARAYGDEPD